MQSYYKLISNNALRTNLFVALTWGIGLLGYAYGFISSIPFINNFASAFIPTVVLIVLFFTFSAIRSNFRISDYLLVYFSAAIYLLHWFLLFPENSIYCEETWLDYLLCCLPFFFVGLVINPDKHIKILEYTSMISIIIILTYYYVKISDGEIVTEVYSGSAQGLAFKLLPHTLLLLSSIIRRFEIFKFVSVLFSVFAILGTGNRSSLLIILLFVVFALIIITKSLKTKLSILIFASILIVVFVNYLPDVLDSLTGYGLNTRSINKIIEGNFIESSGRSSIITQLLESINEQPFFGQGFCSDRRITSTHEYSHNLLLELILTFGVLLGSIIFLAIIILIYRGYVHCKTDIQKSFWLVMFFCGFFFLFISGSFLSHHYFYMMLGYSLCMFRNNHKL